MRWILTLLAAVALACDSEVVWPDTPPLTCDWVQVDLDEGPDLTTPAGDTVDDVLAWLTEPRGTVPTADGPAPLRIEVRQVGDVRRIERRLPPNREVFTDVPGVPCAAGERLQLGASGVVLIDHPTVGPLRIGPTWMRVEVAALDGTVWFTAAEAHAPLDEAPFPWRALVAGAWPDAPAGRAGHALLLGASGTFDEGAARADVVVREDFGDATGPRETTRLAWP